MRHPLPAIAACLLAGSQIACSQADTRELPTPHGSSMAADIAGPDGILYPNFTRAGVPGGIPKVAVVARLEEFGGRPGADIADALENGARAVETRGGGALLIGPGTYYFDRPTLITGSNVVFRGAGPDQTKLIFRWEPKEATIDFIGLKEGDVISPNRPITVAAWNPSRDNRVEKSIRRIAYEINGQPAAQQNGGEGPWFAVSQDNRKTALQLKEGANSLRAVVEYLDGRTAEKAITVTVDKTVAIAAGPTETAIQFAEPTAGKTLWSNGDLARMPRRGDLTLEFQREQSYQPGDVVRLQWPEGGWMGHPLLTVARTEGKIVHLAQPVRQNLEAVSSVRKFQWIRHSGVEDLTLEQAGQHWTNLLGFSGDYGCWVQGVRLVNAGRFPISGGTKHFEIRDTEVDGARFHFGVGGGTGYFGFSGSQDCLAENVRTRKLRHAPNLQFGAQGNVIRNCVFEDSDLQFHRDATWDNLIENCVVRSRGSNKFYGSYGSAITITTATKGDLGARNVIWNNDFISDTIYKGGSAINITGGTMTGWIIAYNRFLHDVGFVLKSEGAGHDLTLKENVFAIREPEAVLFKGDVSGLKLLGNQFYNLAEGAWGGEVAEQQNNRFEAANSAPERPKAPVASLYEWQKQQVAASTKTTP